MMNLKSIVVLTIVSLIFTGCSQERTKVGTLITTDESAIGLLTTNGPKAALFVRSREDKNYECQTSVKGMIVTSEGAMPRVVKWGEVAFSDSPRVLSFAELKIQPDYDSVAANFDTVVRRLRLAASESGTAR